MREEGEGEEVQYKRERGQCQGEEEAGRSQVGAGTVCGVLLPSLYQWRTTACMRPRTVAQLWAASRGWCIPGNKVGHGS
jgi:hypothetical protein